MGSPNPHVTIEGSASPHLPARLNGGGIQFRGVFGLGVLLEAGHRGVSRENAANPTSGGTTRKS